MFVLSLLPAEVVLESVDRLGLNHLHFVITQGFVRKPRSVLIDVGQRVYFLDASFIHEGFLIAQLFLLDDHRPCFRLLWGLWDLDLRLALLHLRWTKFDYRRAFAFRSVFLK